MEQRISKGIAAVAVIVATTGCAAQPAEPSPDDALYVDPVGALTARGLAAQVRGRAADHGMGPMDPPPPLRRELVDLGRALAFDKILSGNRNISCMTCHHPSLGLGDGRHISVGEGASGLGAGRQHPSGVFIPRNAPPLFNLHVTSVLFWDGRVAETEHGLVTPAGAQLDREMRATLELGAVAAQAMFPVISPEEMRGRPGTNELADFANDDFTGIWAALMDRLGAIPAYVRMFEAAYPGTDFEDMTFAHAGNAIAAFEIASLSFVDTPWDRFLAGDDAALTQRELRGAWFFLTAGNCAGCHSGPALSDMSFHATAVPQIGPGQGHGPRGTDDFGRAGVTGDPADRYAFRTPPLRNVALTGPWGHAGQFVSLADYGFHYVDPEAALLGYDPMQLEPALRSMVEPNQAELLDVLDPEMDPATLDQQTMNTIAAFVGALTDDEARNLTHLIPSSVPSGLPVSDDAPGPVVDGAPR